MLLMICEKRSQAEAFSVALGLRQGRGCYEGRCLVGELVIGWASGHLLTLEPPQMAKEGISWNDPATLTPIPTTYKRIVSPAPKGAKKTPKQYLDTLKSLLARNPEEVIIGCDADREGEAIGWEIIEHLKWRGPVTRAWFAAGQDKRSVESAIANRHPPERFKGMYRAAEARTRGDWAFMFLVRAYTYYASYSVFGTNLGRGSSAPERVMSVGRIQSPLTAMVVRREEEIQNFVERDHFLVLADVEDSASRSFSCTYKPIITSDIIERAVPGVTWVPSQKTPKDGEPDPLDVPLFTGRSEAEAFRERLEQSSARLIDYKEGKRKENPPKPFSLSDAQMDMSKKLGVGGSLIQTILEDLYEQGFTSYARTPEQKLPMNFYHRDELLPLLAAPRGVEELRELSTIADAIHSSKHPSIKPFRPASFTNEDLSHWGIIPTQVKVTDATLASFSPRKAGDTGRVEHTSEQMRGVYRMVAHRFLQSMLPPAIYSTQTAVIEFDTPDLLGNPKSRFVAKGEVMDDPGWRLKPAVAGDGTVLPMRSKGSAIAIVGAKLQAKRTSPPSRYTKATLPKAMENISRQTTDPKMRRVLKDSKGVGTPATRKTGIETILKRKYIEQKGRSETLLPTEKGKDAHRHVEPWVTRFEETALWEDYLVKIAETQDDLRACSMRDEFVEKITRRVEKLIAQLRERHDGNLGEKVAPLKRPVSPKMKMVVDAVAKRKGIKVSPKIRSDYTLARAFLEEHREAPADDSQVSEAQLSLAKKIIAALPDTSSIPDNVLTSRKACSAFIDKHKSSLPPSQKMQDYARKIAEKLDDSQKPPESTFLSAKACSAFLDKHTKKPAKSKSSARRTRPKR